MALYAIADTHLSLGGAQKSMDVFHGWDHYVDRLERNWRALVAPEDTVVIAGDVSWAMRLADTAADFRFLNRLPGRKLLLKGNHDYWWTTGLVRSALSSIPWSPMANTACAARAAGFLTRNPMPTKKC